MKRHRKTTSTLLKSLAFALLALLITVPLGAEENPYMKANNTWININGTVVAVHPDTFQLDYGDGIVTVEMDDGDRDADAYKLLKGDKVTVAGMIDDDFYEMTTIEAGSVYVEKLGTYFYSSSLDEEDLVSTWTSPWVIAQTTVKGTVTEVRDEEFVLDTGLRTLTVEVEELPYNPLDDEGYQKIEVGDQVSVIGQMDSDLFEGRELVADAVMTHNA